MIRQGTPEWHEARLGRVTASRVADVIARTRSGWGASRENYMAELVAERLTNASYEGYTSAAMQWGIDTEAYARTAYEFYQDAAVDEAGFFPHPTITLAGASPDGLIGEDGLVEIKCPNTATHIGTLRTHAIAEKYITQMMWQMACTGRAWCDFVSFDPRMPEDLRMFVRRVERNDTRIAELEKEVTVFLAEVDAAIRELTERVPANKTLLETSLLMAG